MSQGVYHFLRICSKIYSWAHWHQWQLAILALNTKGTLYYILIDFLKRGFRFTAKQQKVQRPSLLPASQPSLDHCHHPSARCCLCHSWCTCVGWSLAAPSPRFTGGLPVAVPFVLHVKINIWPVSRKSSTALELVGAPSSPLSPLPAPSSYWSLCCLHGSACLRVPAVGVTQCVAFPDCLLALHSKHLRFLRLFSWLASFFFPLEFWFKTPLSRWTTVRSFTYWWTSHGFPDLTIMNDKDAAEPRLIDHCQPKAHGLQEGLTWRICVQIFMWA